MLVLYYGVEAVIVLLLVAVGGFVMRVWVVLNDGGGFDAVSFRGSRSGWWVYVVCS